MKQLPFIILCLVVLLGITSMGCSSEKPNDQATPPGADSTSVALLNNEVFGVARIEPEKEIISLTAGASGKIIQILVDENQSVLSGSEVLLLDQAIDQAQLKQASSKITAQEAAEKVALATVEQVKIELANTEKDLELARTLFAGNAETKQNVREQEDRVAELRARLNVAETQYQQTVAQRIPLQADVNYFETQIRQKRIVLPESGRILKVLVHSGEYVNATTPILEYAPEGPIVAHTEVDELFADRVQVGQSAAIYSQMTGAQLATGKVIFAADFLSQKSLFKNQSTELEDRRVREVKVELDQGSIPLLGSRVDCRIFINP